MNDTAIRWTEVTWNPASGCKKVSAGCKHCYAEALSEKRRGTPAFPNGFDLTLRPHKLKEPYRLKEPTLIFVNSMSDLFWEEITDEYRDQVLDVIEDTPQHQYQVLTKRTDVMLRYSRRRSLPANFWAGTSVEDQPNALKRIPVLRQVKAEIRFLSAEPIVGHIDLDPFLGGNNAVGGDGIQWVIFGGESGAHLTKPSVMKARGLVERQDDRWVPRADRIPWARDMRDSCQRHGVAFFFKQWGGPIPTSGGKLLDGRAWEELPRLPKPSATKHDRGGARNFQLPMVK